MKQTITQSMFIDDMRAIRPDNFSYEGLCKLFDYLDEMGEENEMEFDPIAICCTFSQCSLKEFLEAFPDVVEADEDYFSNDDDKRQAIEDYISYHGFWFAFVEGGQEVVFENF